jgi:pimeloyl-ACP methyl ester carboxylesterase
MGTAVVRGAHLRYEVLGTDGPWFVLTPGGRFGLEASRALGEQIAAAGSRVLLHDRLSCGASDVVISDGDWEDEATAGYLHELMQMLGATPAIAVGAGGGNRINFFLALRHPSALRGIVPCWPTGGRQAAEILAREYYGQFAEAAREGGMVAVCDTDYYRERIECNSRNRDLLLAMDVSAFIAAMERWQQVFLQSADWPTVAVPEAMLRDISVPALVLAGLTDDHIHGRAASEAVAAAIPGAEIRYFPDERRPANAGASWLREALQRRGAMPDLPEAILDFAGELSGVKSAHTGA